MRAIVMATFVLAITTGVAAQPAPIFKAKLPMLITSFGQSQDANFVDLIGKRLKVERFFGQLLYVKDVDWTKYKTFIYVIGGSGKGLGAAGLDIDDELKRCKAVLAEAKKRGMTIIAMHIGGADRRLENTTPFLDFCKQANYMIVKEDGNQDGYFTKASKDSGIPLRIVKTTLEVQDVLKEIFGL
jgi:hypothetical protein